MYYKCTRTYADPRTELSVCKMVQELKLLHSMKFIALWISNYILLRLAEIF
jgi:hypothetical protein